MESLLDLKGMLQEYGYVYEDIPMVFQYNKRDLADITSVEEFEEVLNDKKAPFFESIAIQNKKVMEAFKAISWEVVEKLNQTLAARKN